MFLFDERTSPISESFPVALICEATGFVCEAPKLLNDPAALSATGRPSPTDHFTVNAAGRR